MGDPKKSRKKYESLKRPFETLRIEEEKELKKKYGLRRNKELRKAESILRNIRRRARELVATKDVEEEKRLTDKVHKRGLTKQKATLDDILKLNIENVLERRIQTQLLNKKLANTMLQARQFISHGHILVNGNKVTSPSFLVSGEDEDKIELSSKSKLKKSFVLVKKKVKKERDVKKWMHKKRN